MNATEKKYAIGRINEVAETKRKAIYKATVLADEVILTPLDKVKLIAAGEVKPKSDNVLKRLSHWERDKLDAVFDFSAHATPEKVDLRKRGAQLKALDKEVQKITDKIMLGDSDVALKMIAAFEKK